VCFVCVCVCVICFVCVVFLYKIYFGVYFELHFAFKEREPSKWNKINQFYFVAVNYEYSGCNTKAYTRYVGCCDPQDPGKEAHRSSASVSSCPNQAEEGPVFGAAAVRVLEAAVRSCANAARFYAVRSWSERGSLSGYRTWPSARC
jgi:hypothetical protein